MVVTFLALLEIAVPTILKLRVWDVEERLHLRFGTMSMYAKLNTCISPR